MCKQDIQIGRSLTPTRATVNVAGAGTVSALKGRVDRIGLAVAVSPELFTAQTEYVAVGVRLGTGVFSLVYLNWINGYAYLRIQDYGSDLTGEIMIQHNVAVVASVQLTEYYLNTELEKV